MTDPVLAALSRKRVDLAGQINRLEAQVRQLTADLGVVSKEVVLGDFADWWVSAEG